MTDQPAVTPRVINRDETAALIGRSLDWFSRHKNRALLHAQGFPRPLPFHGAPKWDRKAVELWLDSFIPAALREAGDDANAEAEAARKRLLDRAQQLRKTG